MIKETGNIINNISFGTRTLPCLNEFYNLFYKNRVKIVPRNIEELITVESLAYWILVDGSCLSLTHWDWITAKKGYGLRLHTNNLTKAEVELLIKAINNKFGFISSINTANKNKDQYTIYIPSKDIDNLKSLILPYILPTFLSKLGINS